MLRSTFFFFLLFASMAIRDPRSERRESVIRICCTSDETLSCPWKQPTFAHWRSTNATQPTTTTTRVCVCIHLSTRRCFHFLRSCWERVFPGARSRWTWPTYLVIECVSLYSAASYYCCRWIGNRRWILGFGELNTTTTTTQSLSLPYTVCV